jgi:transaldolase
MATTVSAQTALHRLQALGQSVWLDSISRGLIHSGELQRLVDQGLLGMTSNPTIFEKAITGSADYDDLLRQEARAGQSPAQIFEALAVRDIQEAADVLRPLYDRLDGADGYVSLEVSPHLAGDTEGTIAEAERLWKAVGRPNVMIKIPGTAAGLPAIAATIGKGINVNVTLLFDVGRYEAVTGAYLEGLERYARNGGDRPMQHIASVASFFVSRVDTMVDKLLEGKPEGRSLMGLAAVANAKRAYARFERIFGGARFDALRAQGARVQRVLWASTSTKNPDYPDLKYVDALIGPHTINTVPQPTLEAILDHVTVRSTITEGMAEAEAQLAALKGAGIDLPAVGAKLEEEGVALFAKSYDDLLRAIEKKAADVAA